MTRATKGETLEIEFRLANGDAAALPGLAAELVRLKVDLIVAYAGDAETSTVVAGGIRCRATLPQAAHAVRTATSCSKGDETKPVRVELSSELMLSRCGDVL